MAEEIKELIEKIQQEGIKAAEDKAQQIEAQAKQQAQNLIAQAKSEAAKVIAQAQEKINKMEEAHKTSLTQAGRNLLIALKKEINALLEKIIVLSIRHALTPQELAKIISAFIREKALQEKGNIIVSLSQEDLKKLEEDFLGELKEEIKKGLTLKAQEDISGGFLISFDSGKSYFDFTDQALAGYLGQYLKPELAKLLNTKP